MTSVQMAKARESLMRAPPLSLTGKISSVSYSSKRGIIGLVHLLKNPDLSDAKIKALGKWRKLGGDMPAHDHNLKLQQSFSAKHKIVNAVKRTAEIVVAKDKNKARIPVERCAQTHPIDARISRPSCLASGRHH